MVAWPSTSRAMQVPQLPASLGLTGKNPVKLGVH
jgi:hypothetical protein